MSPAGYFLLALLVAAGIYLLYRVVVAALHFKHFAGKMLVTCPETQRPAAVKVDNWGAVLAPSSSSQLKLSACSRWPERRECAQQCLCQIEEDPDAHRVWTIASQWFAGKECAYCGHTIEFSHLEHVPALLDTEKKMSEWSHLAPEKLQDAFAASLPVCWNCYVTENFIREHPGRVVVRPWKHSPPWARN